MFYFSFKKLINETFHKTDAEFLSFIILTIWNFQGKKIYLLAAPLLLLLWAKFISWFHWVEFPVVFKWHFAYICTGRVWMQWDLWSKRQVFWLILPLTWHFSDPWSHGLTSFVPFFPLIYGVRIYTLVPGLVEKHIVRPDRMIAFEVLRTNTSHTVENLFHRNCRRRSGSR